MPICPWLSLHLLRHVQMATAKKIVPTVLLFHATTTAHHNSIGFVVCWETNPTSSRLLTQRIMVLKQTTNKNDSNSDATQILRRRSNRRGRFSPPFLSHKRNNVSMKSITILLFALLLVLLLCSKNDNNVMTLTAVVAAATADTDAAASSSSTTTDDPDIKKSPPRMITPEELARYVSTAGRSNVCLFFVTICRHYNIHPTHPHSLRFLSFSGQLKDITVKLATVTIVVEKLTRLRLQLQQLLFGYQYLVKYMM